MKLKTTKKEISNGYNDIIKIGYSQAQNLLQCENAFAYSSGIYGWSCDYYNIDGVIISTGYAPIGKEADYNLIKKYDKKAIELANSYYSNYDYKAYKNKLRKLINKFISEVLKND